MRKLTYKIAQNLYKKHLIPLGYLEPDLRSLSPAIYYRSKVLTGGIKMAWYWWVIIVLFILWVIKTS